MKSKVGWVVKSVIGINLRDKCELREILKHPDSLYQVTSCLHQDLNSGSQLG